MSLSAISTRYIQESIHNLEQQLEYGPMALILDGNSSDRQHFVSNLSQISLTAYEVLAIPVITSPEDALTFLAQTMGLAVDENLEQEILQIITSLEQNILLIIDTDGVGSDMLAWWMSWLAPEHPVFPCVKMLFTGEYAQDQVEQIRDFSVEVAQITVGENNSIPEVPFESFNEDLMGQIASETTQGNFPFCEKESEEDNEDTSGSRWLWPSIFIGAGVGIGAAVAFIWGAPTVTPKLLEEKDDIIVDFSIGEALDGTFSHNSIKAEPELVEEQFNEDPVSDDEEDDLFYHPLGSVEKQTPKTAILLEKPVSSDKTVEQETKHTIEQSKLVKVEQKHLDEEKETDLKFALKKKSAELLNESEDPLFELAKEFDEVLEQTSEEKYVLSRYQHNYTLQLLGARSKENIEKFINRNQLTGRAHIIDFSHHKPWYVLIYGDFQDQKSAIKALRTLPDEVQNLKPLARTYKGIQEEILSR